MPDHVVTSVEATERRCHICNEMKSLSEFYDKKGGKYGKESRCIPCKTKWHNEVYAVNPEAKAKASIRSQRCRAKNESKFTRDGITVTEKKCCHCEVVKPASEFTIHHGAKDNLQPRCKACLNSASRNRMAEIRAEVIAEYGGKCSCPHCEESNPYFLTIDHVGGWGAEHRKDGYGSRSIYAYLKKNGFPKDGFRLLCANCNMSLGWFGECGHTMPANSKKEITIN